MSDEKASSPPPFKLPVLKMLPDAPDVGVDLTQLAKAMGGVSKAENATRLMQQAEEQRVLIEKMMNPAGSIRKTYADLEIQKKRLGALVRREIEPAVAPLALKLPSNPILETNRKLKDIESKFEDMLVVMGSAAKIATDIQSHAVQFLEKFDKASEQTDQSAKSAIRIAVLAIVISVISPFIPMGIDYLWPDRTVASLESLTQQIVETRETDRLENERLIRELRESDRQMAEQVLKTLNRREQEVIRLSEAVQSLIEKQ